jgi:hypothetical protein
MVKKTMFACTVVTTVPSMHNAGFLVREHEYSKELEAADVARFGLPADEVIYVCTKPR